MSKKHGKHHRGHKRGDGMTGEADLHGATVDHRPSTARWAGSVDSVAESVPAALGRHGPVPIRPAPGIVAVEPGAPFDLGTVDPDDVGGLDKDWAKDALAQERARIVALQERLYAERARSLLLVFQAIDTGGKDGTIRSVLKGVNPQGCAVASFKVPSSEELDHDFLWRYHARVPGRGMIGVFNRSHYEDVLVVRVKGLVPDAVWQSRYGRINDFERLLTESGTTVVKFFLHISKAEQKRRLEARIADPEKHWKFDPADLVERKSWDAYQQAFADALGRCSTPEAPWLVVPANHKWFRNYVIARTVADTLEAMDPRFPEAAKGIADLTVPD
ncbi:MULTISPECIES: polyphosphate kinase 2 family protein [Methylobacterium]|jgi:PPK2 family polyphosphate:nucleotide phosphotransferase|uniref:polyphosphate kinase 2 family protein n=1 Tax=Methylobacterium TaxID=407 RepID=UPI00037C5883|nr:MULTISPECIES: polyphosphate kinase 2 family protein [Methylobacterium]MBN4096795.1 polyphosphate kinase 2 family protein [Methylobacterium sp. OT2]UIN36194.1 polyphosphate kinase 2 family protein [Methylobacterium oryzae]SEF74013.1 polyphosphate:nucleotide phosphotransferase, PPK2 family [Methylobacterium sp. 190mf]SEH37484.1 polyphosphate:nucleotide phosphotransferase, PPK2 family [Methylobacterium sp. 275MFSha3.1]